MDNEQFETATEISREWGITIPEILSEKEIITRLADKLVDYLQKGPDAFFQLMYRLDIAEKKLYSVMSTKDAAYNIAKLIYERQLQKIRSREFYKGKNKKSNDPEIDW